MAANPNDPIVAALLDAFVDGFNRHDPSAIAMTLAPEIRMTNFRGKSIESREAGRKFFERVFGAGLKASHATSTQRSVRFFGDGVAYVEMRFTLTGAVDPKGGARPDRPALFDAVAVRNPSGGYWFAVLHLRELPAPEPGTPD